MEKIVNIRLLALDALHDIFVHKSYANITLQKYIKEEGLSTLDRRFFTELVYGVCRRKNYLDRIIQHFTKKPLKKLSPPIILILDMALYQLIYMDRVPPQAAVHEAVNLAKKKARGLAPLVNGVLRNFGRQKEKITIEKLSSNHKDKLVLTYNLPLWMIDILLDSYTQEEVKQMAAYFSEAPSLKGRINTLKGSVEEVFAKVQEEVPHLEKSQLFPEGCYFPKLDASIGSFEWFNKGYVSVMDEGSLVIPHVVNPQEGERILDMCAAPGGKSLHMAALQNNNGHIDAFDKYEHKIELIKENVQRLGATSVHPRLMDAFHISVEEVELYDKVLVDAPCSGLGILQKKLDMRWHKEKASVDALPELQSALLAKGAKLVKPGGFLIYSTCTLHREENEGVVQSFLQSHPNFSLDDASKFVPFPMEGPMITMRPDVHGTDGFFVTRLQCNERE